MRIVIGVGGNALLKRGELPEMDIQRENVSQACRAIAKLADEHEIIITHGNGPQVGLLALQAAAYKEVPVYPFDVLGAESQGMIGYLLAQELRNQLPHKKVVCLLTQVEVNQNDLAFSHPAKLVGPIYNEQQASKLAKKYHWKFAKDGEHIRRVMPSPMPCNILEIKSIQALLDGHTIVICLGGGGIPVVRKLGRYVGIEAVIDKDFSTALLAEKLDADRMLLLTDVTHVVNNWGEPDASPINTIHYKELAALSFASGSMRPKVAAACQFVQQTKRIAHIGALSDAKSILQQETGTTILAE